MDGVILTKLKRLFDSKGDVFHAMKEGDIGFYGFGEAYFSTVNQDCIKGWKKHLRMTLNLVVCAGRVKFVVYDDRSDSISNGSFYEVVLSHEYYCRLTVPPHLWMGFQGQDDMTSTLLNMVDTEHCADELDRLAVSEINYDWRRGI